MASFRATIRSTQPAPSLIEARRLTNLQVLRTLAAASVMLTHCATEVRIAKADAAFASVFGPSVGFFGVALFFAISGFLMSQLLPATSPATFLLHRVVRIYPIYLIVALGYIALGFAFGLDVRRDWLALTLVPAGQRNYTLGVEWTLLYETTFYVLLFLVATLGLATRLRIVAWLWLTLIIVASLAGFAASRPTLFPPLHYVPFASITGAFVIGLLIPGAIARGWMPVWLCALVLVGVALVLYADPAASDWLLSLAAPFVVAGAVQLPQLAAASLPSRGLIRCGDWSYALYLVHMPAIMMVLHVAPQSLSAVALFAAACALSLVASAVFGVLDVGLYRRLRRRVDRISHDGRRWPAWIFATIYLGLGTVFAVQFETLRRAEARAHAAVSAILGSAKGQDADVPDAIARADRGAPASLVAKIDRIAEAPAWTIEAVGWAIDLEKPGRTVQLALICGGKIAAIGRPKRLRPAVAAEMSRPELRHARIGFSIVFPRPACPAGAPILPIFVDGRERLLALPAIVPAPE